MQVISVDIHKANGFVITTEPLGFVQTERVGDFLPRVHDFDFIFF